MRWVFRLLSAVPSAAVTLTLAHISAAQAPSEPFVVVSREAGAESCPDTAMLVARVEQVRGHAADDVTTSYRVTFTRRGGVLQAAIQGGNGGARLLRDRGEACDSLEQATAVTLALLLDSDLSEPAGPAEAPASSRAAARIEAKPSAPPAPARKRARLAVALGGAGVFGASRPVAPAFVGDLGIGIGRFRTTLGALWLPPTELDFGPGQLRESLLGGTARLCLAPWLSSSLRLDLCSGVYAGIVRVSAQGYTRNESANKAWLSLPLELALSTTPRPVGFELGASALLPLRRNDFAIDRLGVAYESWPIGLMVTGRVVVGFGL